MFWLLSYVSLGLALTVGNRPISIHSSQHQQNQQQQQQQQQKQQSTSSSSSSQTQKSRQDHRFLREPTIADVSNELSSASAPEEQLDHLRTYRYEEPVDMDNELDRDWFDRADRPWRDPSGYFRHRMLDNESENEDKEKEEDRRDTTSNERERKASSTRENAFLDEFDTAFLDTLYPRHRNLLVLAKPPNIRTSYQNNRFDDADEGEPSIGYVEATQMQQKQKTLKKSARSLMTAQREFAKKMIRSPMIVYRTDQSENPSLSIDGKFFHLDKREERLLSQRAPSIVNNLRSSDGWVSEPTDYTNRNNEMKTKGETSDFSYESIGSASSNSKPSAKRNQGGGSGGGGRGRSSNPRGWMPTGQPGSPPVTMNVGANIASQFLLRSARGNRQYDVPQIGKLQAIRFL